MPKPPSLTALHRENLAKFDILATEVRAHIVADNARFNTIDEALGSIAKDVKSLIGTRSFTKGVWWTVSIIAVAISTVASIAVAWVKG
mgnify:CR=1 FL=1